MTRKDLYGDSCYEKFIQAREYYYSTGERCQEKCQQCGLGKDCYAAWSETTVNEEGEVI